MRKKKKNTRFENEIDFPGGGGGKLESKNTLGPWYSKLTFQAQYLLHDEMRVPPDKYGHTWRRY